MLPRPQGFEMVKRSHGFRLWRNVSDGVANPVALSYTQAIDAALSMYFDSIPHAKLLAVVAERIVDGGILSLIKQWLKAPVVGEDDKGVRRTVEAVKPIARALRKAG